MHFHVGGSIFAPSRTLELEIELQPNIYIESHSSIRVRHHGINASCADGSKNELQRNINIGLLLTFQHRTPNSTCLGLVGRGPLEQWGAFSLAFVFHTARSCWFASSLGACGHFQTIQTTVCFLHAGRSRSRHTLCGSTTSRRKRDSTMCSSRVETGMTISGQRSVCSFHRHT